MIKEKLPANRPAAPEALFLTTDQAARVLGLSAKHLRNLRVAGDGPAFTRMGQATKAVRYARQALLDWANSRTVASTSAKTTQG